MKKLLILPIAFLLGCFIVACTPAEALEEYQMPAFDKEGYQVEEEWQNALQEQKDSFAIGTAENTIAACGQYISEYDANVLREMENRIRESNSIYEVQAIEERYYNADYYLKDNAAKMKAAEEEAARVAAEQAKQNKKSTSYNNSGYSGGTSYNYNGPGLTRSNGRNLFNGHIETWYSTREAGQTVTAKPIPGRYTDENGVIRDADGYVCVATNQKDYKFGETVETSHGTGKVYDTGCASGVVDVYTEW